MTGIGETQPAPGDGPAWHGWPNWDIAHPNYPGPIIQNGRVTTASGDAERFRSPKSADLETVNGVAPLLPKDEIAEIGLDGASSLYVRTASNEYPYICRMASGVR